MKNLKNTKYKHSLGKILLGVILLVSGIITTSLTTISFYRDYKDEMNSLDIMFNQIEKGSSGGLAEALWNLDDDQIKTLSRGITQIQDVVGIKIYDEKNKVVFEQFTESNQDDSLLTKKYPLTLENQKNVGMMVVTATKSNMFRRIVNRAVYFFISQGLKTLLTSLLVLFIFKKLVTRHIFKISEYFEEHYLKKDEDSASKDLVLDRQKRNDELDFLVDVINKIRRENDLLSEERSEQLRKIKAASLNQAKLASLGETTAGIAHEINNPLAIISGYNDMIRELANKPEINSNESQALKVFTSKIAFTVERVKKIIQTMLALSRQGAEKDNNQSCSLSSLTKDVVELFFGKIRDNNIEFKNKLEDKPEVMVRGNKAELLQVLLNLIGNAIEAVSDKKDPWIEVDYDVKDLDIRFSITDCGHGISEDLQAKIFEPFFTTKSLGKGTGLGLGIAKTIVNGWEGDIYLDNESRNTRFIISLKTATNVDKIESEEIFQAAS